MTDFFLVRTASLFTLRTFGAQINWRVISRTDLICTASLFVKQITYSFCRRERKQKYVSQWHMTRSKWKWTSIATVPDLCPTTVKILTHLISRYQLPWSPEFVMQNIHTVQQKVTINIFQSLQLIRDVFNCFFVTIQKLNSWTNNFVEVSWHNLESSQTWGFHTQCLHYKPVSNTTFARGGGGGGKSVRLLSQLHPRVRPLYSIPVVLPSFKPRPALRIILNALHPRKAEMNICNVTEIYRNCVEF